MIVYQTGRPVPDGSRSGGACPAKLDGMARQVETSEREVVREARHDGAPARRQAPLAAILTGRRWRLAARWIGLIIFFLGAGLLGFVFIQALKGFSSFASPGYIQAQVNKISGDGTQALVTAYVSVVGGELLRLIYLLLLGYLGSLISAKGIQFFAASESVIDEAVIGVNEE